MQEIDVDQLIKEMKARVASRRANGDYPAGVEEQLEAEFKEIMASVHRDRNVTANLLHSIQGASNALAGLRAHAESDSRIPGGSVIHATANRLVVRHTGQLAEGVRAAGSEMIGALREVARVLEAQMDSDDRRINEVLGSVIDRLAILDHLASAVLTLEQRVAVLESNQPTLG